MNNQNLLELKWQKILLVVVLPPLFLHPFPVSPPSSFDREAENADAKAAEDIFKQEHLAPWQTPQAVGLVVLELPLGLSHVLASD